MAYVKKISGHQFALDCINKEFEIVKSGLHFNTYDELVEYSKEHKNWFSDFSFKTVEEFKEWKDYFLSHFYDWQPKRVKERDALNEFRWFNMQYGFSYDFDIKELKND